MYTALPSLVEPPPLMDYLKTVIPSQLFAERGSNLLVINPGSANVRIGLAQQDTPFTIPHCISRRTTGANFTPKRNVQDQMLNSQVTTAQHMEREKAYDVLTKIKKVHIKLKYNILSFDFEKPKCGSCGTELIASVLKIPFLDEELGNNSIPRKMGRVDGVAPQGNKKETTYTWTDVLERNPKPSSVVESSSDKGETSTSPVQLENTSSISELHSSERKYRECIYGEEALRISPTEPYCLRRPIRRGHLNVSQYYPMQQVLEDLHAIWDWILVEKLHIPQNERHVYSAILVVPETFDNREVKEILSIVLRDLGFITAVVHQEGLAAVFGHGLSTACVVSMGAQVTSVICVEDGVALPNTQIILNYGGEDISRCLLWTQRHHQTWPPIRTDTLMKPVDLLMLNKLKESYCQIREGEVEAVSTVHSYEDGMPAGSHKTKLTALNVAPMGLFYPTLLVPDVYPSPPRSWLSDHEDMLEDTWHMELPRRTDMSDGFFPGMSSGMPMWDNYPIFQNKSKKEYNIGLADAISKSILSAGRIDLQRRLFCSMQLIGGVALTSGLVSAVEERVLLAIPSNEAIDTVEVLQSRTNPSYVSWKGGAILGVLDFVREAWIHREDWIKNGIYPGSGRKYKDSYYLQAQVMCYMNN